MEIHLFELLKFQTNLPDFYALAIDETNDITNTTQLIFMRCSDNAFHVHEEIVILWKLSHELKQATISACKDEKRAFLADQNSSDKFCHMRNEIFSWRKTNCATITCRGISTALAFNLYITWANEFNIKFQGNAKLLRCLFSDVDVCEMKLSLLHKGASREQPGHFPFWTTLLEYSTSPDRLAEADRQACRRHLWNEFSQGSKTFSRR